eukprot:CAMPEP_0183512054 /NCGR_PEP_ID=MMETSP0371-20130417/11305_1 /TAXON_ID=268820 /ORGANISM="Peridinium aciculiferum, Strain PAER-2" /LENGTH=258 /DNA_ID=CAMNT_0025709067 /DNA_START=154 /DNA_END=926 /DNA_ORIENTATION=+
MTRQRYPRREVVLWQHTRRHLRAAPRRLRSGPRAPELHGEDDEVAGPGTGGRADHQHRRQHIDEAAGHSVLRYRHRHVRPVLPCEVQLRAAWHAGGHLDAILGRGRESQALPGAGFEQRVGAAGGSDGDDAVRALHLHPLPRHIAQRNVDLHLARGDSDGIELSPTTTAMFHVEGWDHHLGVDGARAAQHLDDHTVAKQRCFLLLFPIPVDVVLLPANHRLGGTVELIGQIRVRAIAEACHALGSDRPPPPRTRARLP